MRIFRFFFFLLLIYLLQVIIVSRFAVFGVKADLFLVMTALFAVNLGAERGFVIGLLCGIIQDIFGTSFYFHSATMAILGFLVGTFKESIIGTEEGIALTAVIAATVTNFLLQLLLLFFFFGKPLASPLILLGVLVVSCFYNSLLAFIFNPLVKFSTRFLVAEQ